MWPQWHGTSVCLEMESGMPGRTLVRQDRGRDGSGGEESGVWPLRLGPSPSLLGV